MAYIEIGTGSYPISEADIRGKYPNTTFPKPFKKDGFEVVFETPKPSCGILETVFEASPILTLKGTWEQTWIVTDKFQDIPGGLTKAEQEQTFLDQELSKEKKALTDKINVIRYSKIYMESIPYLFPGDTEPDGVQMRNDIDRQNIQDVVTDAILRDPGDIMYFMPTSNNLKTMTAQQIKDMGQFVKGRGDGIVGYAWGLKGQVNGATTIEELNSIDINAGWPE